MLQTNKTDIQQKQNTHILIIEMVKQKKKRNQTHQQPTYCSRQKESIAIMSDFPPCVSYDALIAPFVPHIALDTTWSRASDSMFTPHDKIYAFNVLQESVTSLFVGATGEAFTGFHVKAY